MRKNPYIKSLAFALTTGYIFSVASAVTMIDNFSVTDFDLSNVVINSNFLEDIVVARRITSSDFIINGTPQLVYAGSSIQSVVYNFSPDFDMSSPDHNHLRLTFENISSNFIGEIALMSTAGMRSVLAEFTTGNNVYNIDLTTGMNTFNFNLASVNQIDLNFNMEDNQGNLVSDLTFSLDTIEAVPEPFSMAIMGTGLVAFVKRRRQKITKR